MLIFLCSLFYAGTAADPCTDHEHAKPRQNQSINQSTEQQNEGAWKTADGFPGRSAAGEVKDLEKSTRCPPHPPPSTPSRRGSEPCYHRWRPTALLRLDRRSADPRPHGIRPQPPPPPPPPSAALLKLRDPVKDRQALQGEKKR